MSTGPDVGPARPHRDAPSEGPVTRSPDPGESPPVSDHHGPTPLRRGRWMLALLRGRWALAALALFVKLRSTYGGREQWVDAIVVDTWGHGGLHGIRWLQAVTADPGRELRLDGELIAGPHLPQRLG